MLALVSFSFSISDCTGHFPADVLFSQVYMGMVGQVVYGSRKFPQRFPGMLDPSPQLSMECFRQVAIIVVILVHHQWGCYAECVWWAHSR
jgi:hypothetical protein